MISFVKEDLITLFMITHHKIHFMLLTWKSWCLIVSSGPSKGTILSWELICHFMPPDCPGVAFLPWLWASPPYFQSLGFLQEGKHLLGNGLIDKWDAIWKAFWPHRESSKDIYLDTNYCNYNMKGKQHKMVMSPRFTALTANSLEVFLSQMVP